METTVTVVVPASGARHDVVVAADPGTSMQQIVAKLAQLAGVEPASPVAVDGGPLPPTSLHAPAADVLSEGAILTIADDSRAPEPAGYVELRVVDGPAAGATHRLPLGAAVIGRGSNATIRIDDPDVSRQHAVLDVDAQGVRLRDAGSRNGTTLDGQPVTREPIVFTPGARLRVGDSVLVLGQPDEPPAFLAKAADGQRAFNRAPRLDAPINPAPTLVTFPPQPSQSPSARLPIVATVAPLIAGVALALVMRRPEYLLFTVLSPVMVAGQWVADRTGDRRTARAARVAYVAAHSGATKQLAAAVEADRRRRHREAPDLAQLVQRACSRGTRLWERARSHNDFLHIRLGYGQLPARVEVSGVDGADATLLAADVPVTINFPNVGVLGVAGARPRTLALARAVLTQLAVLHSPCEVSVVVLTDEAGADDWEWIRWLPHARPSSGQLCSVLVGMDAASVASRVAELREQIGASKPHRDADNITDRAATLLVLDGARALRGVAGIPELLRAGPAAEIYALCLDTEESALPAECNAVATFTGATATRLDLKMPAGEQIREVVASGLPLALADRVSRALAPICDATRAAASGGLPNAVSWLDIAGISHSDLGAHLGAAWSAPRGRAFGVTRVALGRVMGGDFCVDIARDGPHALVAGTTGSGKSELLQTLVAALAVANRPDEMTFVLVDYKGGAAFGACAELPHTVGLVTDLDGSLVERALFSLSAELKRRETLLASKVCANIDDFRAAGGALARLLIVVDEFAGLAEELPDFVRGLVAIAQRGRSLGVHLVLATQRPEGVVNADIRANTNLRICLAVTRDTESRDVIDAPDAARISRTTPGRGYARTGHAELHAFQAGRVGGLAPAAAAIGGAPGEVRVRPAPFRTLATLPPSDRMDAATASQGRTDLDLIVAACRAAADKLRVHAPASPWLPPLPDVVVSDTGNDRALAATLGIQDMPAHQARRPFVVDLDQVGHLLIAGSPRSGRTTALRTLAGALARATSMRDLHLYAIDCGGGALTAVGQLPHCGALLTAADRERVARLIMRLNADVTRRQSELSRAGFASVTEQRGVVAPGPPHVLVLIDGWEAFLTALEEIDAGAVIDGVYRLLREGATCGVHLAITADRAGLIGRLPSAIDTRLVLPLADRADFALIGVPARGLPRELPPGRCFTVGDPVATQICLLSNDPSGPAQSAALSEIAAEASRRDENVPLTMRPRRIESLPATIGLAQLHALSRPRDTGHPPTSSKDATTAQVLLGVGGDDVAPLVIDALTYGPGFVVAGPARSGRSAALATLAFGLRAAGWRTVGVFARRSPLRTAVDIAFDADDANLAEFASLTASIAPAGATTPAALVESLLPTAILVDDAELVAHAPISALLDDAIRTARDKHCLVAIAGTTDDLAVGFRGFIVEARKSRTGILLAPRGPFDGEVLGVRISRSAHGCESVPGRGLLVVNGAPTPMQVALAPNAEPKPQPPAEVGPSLASADAHPQTVTLTDATCST